MAHGAFYLGLLITGAAKRTASPLQVLVLPDRLDEAQKSKPKCFAFVRKIQKFV